MNRLKAFFTIAVMALLVGCGKSDAGRMAYVESDEIDISSKIPGRIDSVKVKNGDHVRKGDLLATLQSGEIRARAEQAKAGLEAARAQLQMAQNGARSEEREMATRQFNIARNNQEMIERMYQRILKVYEEGGVSIQEKEAAEFRYQIAREQYESARAFLEMVKNGARSEQMDQLKAQVRAMEEKVNEARSYLDELSVRAPQDGEIKQVNAQAGEIVTAGFPLITMLDSDRYIIFNLREDDFNGLKTGDSLKISVPALRMETSMTVYHIAAMADFAKYESTTERGSWDVKSFEVRARPDQAIAGLRPGMTIRIKE